MAGGVMKKKKRHYTPKFRLEAVRLLRVSGKSSHQVSIELGISQSVLSRW
jgi:transposase